jgi:hypothetical protein
MNCELNSESGIEHGIGSTRARDCFAQTIRPGYNLGHRFAVHLFRARRSARDRLAV